MKIANLFVVLALGLCSVAQAAEIPLVLNGRVEGGVLRDQRDTIYVNAVKGQTLKITITSPENNAAFDLAVPGGNYDPLAAPGKDAKSISTTAISTGVYSIIVGPTRGNATYDLSVELR